MIFPALNLTVAPRRNDEAAARLIGVAAYPRLGRARLEDAEIAQFDRHISAPGYR